MEGLRYGSESEKGVVLMAWKPDALVTTWSLNSPQTWDAEDGGGNPLVPPMVCTSCLYTPYGPTLTPVESLVGGNAWYFAPGNNGAPPLPSWLELDFGENIYVDKYRIASDLFGAGYNPVDWELHAWPDGGRGGALTVLDHQAGSVPADWPQPGYRELVPSHPCLARYVRVNVTAIFNMMAGCILNKIDFQAGVAPSPAIDPLIGKPLPRIGSRWKIL